MDVLLGKLLLLICAVFVLRTGFTVTNALSSVTLKDGQYNGIVVAISPKVPELSKDDVIEGIKVRR